ncbi:MAG: hypothetical protein DRI84_05375 [Bacteroidetes bacterium]|nr:MAG: hypothetical protein DRI84_05375 [Bacteroidota bacterium]
MIIVYRRKVMKEIGMFIGGIILVCLVIWGCYWLAKTFSYWLFYEDMVKATIRELVNSKYLLTP